MDKITLSEISLIYGSVIMPKGFEIDRSKIKNDIIDSFVQTNRISTNPKHYSYRCGDLLLKHHLIKSLH